MERVRAVKDEVYVLQASGGLVVAAAWQWAWQRGKWRGLAIQVIVVVSFHRPAYLLIRRDPCVARGRDMR